MTTTEKSSQAEKLQSWVPANIAEAVRAQAALERRSVSQTVRLAIEDRLRSRGAGEWRP